MRKQIILVALLTSIIIIIINVPVRAECRIGSEQKISILACF